MSNLELLKNAPQQLSVDEFMRLLFGVDPGALFFDYGDEKDWPKGAAPIYRMLTEDIKARKLLVFLPKESPFYHLYNNIANDLSLLDSPWWHDGKLLKSSLIGWLEEKRLTQAPHPPTETVTEPKSTGSRKDTTRINETRQACEEVTEELYKEKQTFDKDKDNWNPKLLSDTGKISREGYMNAVQTRLGKTTLHRDTAYEAWKAIPTDLKHRGRPQD